MTLVTAKMIKLLFGARVRVRAREGYYRYFHKFIFRFQCSFSPIFILNSPLVLFCSSNRMRETTRRFQQNNTSFSAKQHVVFNKTTRHFQQNNTSFSAKQYVVFSKTICVVESNCSIIENNPQKE